MPRVKGIVFPKLLLARDSNVRLIVTTFLVTAICLVVAIFLAVPRIRHLRRAGKLYE
jgi:hypothetical protein